ncbi:hypothetical protein chiPu_0008510 [Chiloscyllium punctatum]|uniref:Uncharacterized protein n=1 Tax=Chiloscyllium punctatum TaxID=137246 RepID=A0A401SI19_CHIPU|nr:hypothetical protein [Chiloscyllium punctatum]
MSVRVVVPAVCNCVRRCRSVLWARVTQSLILSIPRSTCVYMQIYIYKTKALTHKNMVLWLSATVHDFIILHF